jgi:hypothetical protein
MDYGDVKKRVWGKTIQTLPALPLTKGTLKTPGNHPRRRFKQNSSSSVANTTPKEPEKPAKQQNNP